MWSKESKMGSKGNNNKELVTSINQECNGLRYLSWSLEDTNKKFDGDPITFRC